MTEGVLQLVVFVGLLAWVLGRNLPGALLFVRPAWRRSGISGGPESVTAEGHGIAMSGMLADLDALGFRPLGRRWEKKPLRARRDELVLASDEERAYACVAPVGNEAWLYFFTPFHDGATVITGDFRMDGVDEPDYQAGGLPASSPAEVLAAHRRRVRRFLDEGRALPAELTLEAREQDFRRFYRSGPGRRDTRRRELRTAVLTGVALFVVGMLVKNLIAR